MSSIPATSDRYLSFKGIDFDGQGGRDPFWAYFFQRRNATTGTHVTKALPCARWQRVPWQCTTHLLGNCKVNAIAPHRQLPLARLRFMDGL
jgi:hypothetical protein